MGGSGAQARGDREEERGMLLGDRASRKANEAMGEKGSACLKLLPSSIMLRRVQLEGTAAFTPKAVLGGGGWPHQNGAALGLSRDAPP